MKKAMAILLGLTLVATSVPAFADTTKAEDVKVVLTEQAVEDNAIYKQIQAERDQLEKEMLEYVTTRWKIDLDGVEGMRDHVLEWVQGVVEDMQAALLEQRATGLENQVDAIYEALEAGTMNQEETDKALEKVEADNKDLIQALTFLGYYEHDDKEADDDLDDEADEDEEEFDLSDLTEEEIRELAEEHGVDLEQMMADQGVDNVMDLDFEAIIDQLDLDDDLEENDEDDEDDNDKDDDFDLSDLTEEELRELAMEYDVDLDAAMADQDVDSIKDLDFDAILEALDLDDDFEEDDEEEDHDDLDIEDDQDEDDYDDQDFVEDEYDSDFENEDDEDEDEDDLDD